MSYEEHIGVNTGSIIRPQWKKDLCPFETIGGPADPYYDELDPYYDPTVDFDFKEGRIFYRCATVPEEFHQYGEYYEYEDIVLWGGALTPDFLVARPDKRAPHGKKINGKLVPQKLVYHPAVRTSAGLILPTKGKKADAIPTWYSGYINYAFQILPGSVVVQIETDTATLYDDGEGNLYSTTSGYWGEISYKEGQYCIWCADVATTATLSCTAFAGYVTIGDGMRKIGRKLNCKDAKIFQLQEKVLVDGYYYFGWYDAMYPYCILNCDIDCTDEQKYAEYMLSGNIIADQVDPACDDYDDPVELWTFNQLRNRGIIPAQLKLGANV